MVTGQFNTTISIKLANLDHAEACKIAQRVLNAHRATKVILDMTGTRDATTAAFAKLVLLRKQLRQMGRDLVLCGLTGRVAAKYHLCKLDSILPISV